MFESASGISRRGITPEMIVNKRNSIKVGDFFKHRDVVGFVLERYKHFCLIEKLNGTRECIRWVDMLTTT